MDEETLEIPGVIEEVGGKMLNRCSNTSGSYE
jgi:hypothetical protein